MPAPCICIFSALYPPSMGGVEAYTENLARALAETGHRVIVVASNTHALPGRASESGIEVVRLPCRALLGGRFPVPFKNDAYHRLWWWLKQQEIDYVVVNTRFYPHSYEGASFANGKGIVPVLIEHGSAHLSLGNPIMDAGVRAIEHFMTRRIVRFPLRCYGVSRKASEWLSHFNLASCGVLSNSIDADAYIATASNRVFREQLGLPADTFVTASVGRLVKEKGVLELAQALRSIDSEHPFAVIMAGDGPLRNELHALESNRLRLLGKLSSEDVAALLAQADVLCLPSRSEGFATTLLEAAACGTPAIVTDVGGVDELIPDESFGTVIPDRTPETIRRALERAAENRQHLRSQGCNAGKRVRSEYSWEKTAAHAVDACRRAQERRSL